MSMSSSASNVWVCVLLCTLMISPTWGESMIDKQRITEWRLSSSANVKGDGAAISSSGYDASSWYGVTVPCTIMACLIQAGVYSNLFQDAKLESVDTTQFNASWWYRAPFSSPQGFDLSNSVTIQFTGLNYRANVWVNGELIGAESQIMGAFRYFNFEISRRMNKTANGINVIAVEVFRPYDRVFDHDQDTDLAITFVDWAPNPPDYNMGLWREVNMIVAGALTLNTPLVATKLSSSMQADLTVSVNVTNNQNTTIHGALSGSIYTPDNKPLARFSQDVAVGPHQTVTVRFTSSAFSQLHISKPALWWPWQMGDPTLHTLDLQLFGSPQAKYQLSHSWNTSFGIRQMTSELDSRGNTLFSVNHNPILIRGAGWSPDLFLRPNMTKLKAEIAYVRDMNLNAIRLEGKMDPDELFDECDRLGILTMPGWCCCDAWQHWSAWGPEQMLVSGASMLDQANRLRIHASVLMFFISSDELPPQNVEQNYLTQLARAEWPNPTVSAASLRTSKITGSTGVKMSGPYSWVSPNYWLDPKAISNQLGGAYGFLTEGGPGENPLTLESFEATVSPANLWPVNSVWNYHCGAPEGNFGTLNRFTPPLYARYGNATSASGYLQRAQAATYEGHRAMFEAYSRNKYTSTGVIQWMLNSAWPSMLWHLYSYDLTPSSTYFATKIACEDVHIMYTYTDQSVWVVNSLYTDTEGLIATAEIVTKDGKALLNESWPIKTVSESTPFNVATLPSAATLKPKLGQDTVYFLRLRLWASQSSIVSDNFYWLSTAADVIAWSNSTWYNTPCSAYADFTGMQTLPPATVTGSAVYSAGAAKVTVKSTTAGVAFFIRLRLLVGGVDIAPIMWEDNYFSMINTESRTLSAKYAPLSAGVEPSLVVEVYNGIVGEGEDI